MMAQDPMSLVPPWRLGVDVGGTFTDLVLRDGSGALHVVKVPSVPADPSEGVLAALRQAALRFGLGLDRLLGGCTQFIHGSTVATNTVLEKKGARVGLLATAGFRDSLEIRRGLRENQWDHRAPFPPVLVPRYLRLDIGGRIDREGQEIEPLNEADIEQAVATFKAEGVEAIAVTFLYSVLNDAHERQAREVIKRLWPEAWVSLSSEVVALLGEYERGSTTVLNCYLAHRVVAYLQKLDRRLQELGLPRGMLLVQSNGGAISVAQVASRPVNLVLSGPAAGVGALNLYRHLAGSDELIAMEIGGTSCDVTVMSGGAVQVTDQLLIDGYHVAVPAVEIHTVGAGGGTVAGVDAGGMLFVGPRGAGARPGPAAYGLGGQEPTVTDALLVLGRLRAGPLVGGAVSLDLAKASEAIEQKVAMPLKLPSAEAAIGIVRLLEQNLLHAVEAISTERGYNPRGFTLVACGGAGPMHGVSVGRALGCARVYVPREAGAFCAIGMLHADLRQDFQRVFIGELDRVEQAQVARTYGELASQVGVALGAEGFTGADATIEREIDLRYRGQQWSIRVPLAGSEGFDRAAIRAAFEAVHDRLYGHIQPQGAIEITSLHVIGRGRIEAPTAPEMRPVHGTPQPTSTRQVWLDVRAGYQPTAVYDGAALGPGHTLTGPAVIELPTTTVFVGAGDRLEVDAGGNFLIHLRAAEAAVGVDSHAA